MKPEHILAICHSAFEGLDAESCAIFANDAVPIDPAKVVIMQREWLESREEFRQLIPYTVILNDKGEVFVYERTSAAGEERLVGNQSVGFGGHIDLQDVVSTDSVIDLDQTIAIAGVREILEELTITFRSNAFAKAGIIIDDSDEVGRVHVGALQYIVIKNDATVEHMANMDSPEDGIKFVGWAPLESLVGDESLEKWSAASVERLVEIFKQEKVEVA